MERSLFWLRPRPRCGILNKLAHRCAPLRKRSEAQRARQQAPQTRVAWPGSRSFQIAQADRLQLVARQPGNLERETRKTFKAGAVAGVDDVVDTRNINPGQTVELAGKMRRVRGSAK